MCSPVFQLIPNSVEQGYVVIALEFHCAVMSIHLYNGVMEGNKKGLAYKTEEKLLSEIICFPALNGQAFKNGIRGN